MWGDESDAVAPIIWLYQIVDAQKEGVFFKSSHNSPELWFRFTSAADCVDNILGCFTIIGSDNGSHSLCVVFVFL